MSTMRSLDSPGLFKEPYRDKYSPRSDLESINYQQGLEIRPEREFEDLGDLY
jgi:hypothetical protein